MLILWFYIQNKAKCWAHSKQSVKTMSARVHDWNTQWRFCQHCVNPRVHKACKQNSRNIMLFRDYTLCQIASVRIWVSAFTAAPRGCPQIISNMKVFKDFVTKKRPCGVCIHDDTDMEVQDLKTVVYLHTLHNNKLQLMSQSRSKPICGTQPWHPSER